MAAQRSDGFTEHGKRRNSRHTDYHDTPILRRRTCSEDGKTNDYHDTLGSREADFTQPKKKLSHADYTIAWICALSLELEAARYMLDEEHDTLPVARSDDNVYILGSIAGHNIIMTSLRAGVYGLVSATAVGKDILATFPNVKSTPLLVGIGGGCPSPSHDIRLGDVVVSRPTSESPAIRQYDFGKTVHNGIFEIKGSSNKPAPVLLNAVANLEAKHDSLGARIQTHIRDACQKYGFAHKHPGTDRDILFELGCEHPTDNAICGICGPFQSISRTPRGSLCPQVHFGPIASGNQVMKDAVTRSRLALQHGFLCFEMEAAGLMDFLPCLVIRGICDYCDSSKHKDFQPYAALTAAAFAKELISVLPKKITMMEQMEKLTTGKLDRRRRIMEALDFVEADIRRATIERAQHQTCRWLLRQNKYIQWREHWKQNANNALLWLKGNPGTGKSTIMKFVLEDIEKHKSGDDVVISFFFNARGNPLERNTEGLYRSLIVQLLNQFPDLQWVLDKSTFIDSKGDIVVGRVHVVELFRTILRIISGRAVICVVDALDECSEQEVRDMLGEFVAIWEHYQSRPNFRVLFSSRHYPHISIDFGRSFVLEKQDGHANDLAKYIHAELKIGETKQADKLKRDVLDKANGIFLWVVLVVNILKREYDRGRIHEMARRLKEIPTEVDRVLKEILLRSTGDVNELMLCVQWCLYSQRSLKREEFYFAMLSANEGIPIEEWNHEEATPEIMDRFILDCSRGLVEITRGTHPVVQFIHESVREFFLTPTGFPGLLNHFHDVRQAHEKLRSCCHRLLTSEAMETAAVSKVSEIGVVLESLGVAPSQFPFFNYAANFVLHHANEAGEAGKDQTEFFQAFCTPRWVSLYNAAVRNYQLCIAHTEWAVLYYLIDENLQQLIVIWLDNHSITKEDLGLLLREFTKHKGIDTAKRFLLKHGQKALSQTGNIDLVRFELLIDLFLDGFTAFWPEETHGIRGRRAVFHLPQLIWVSTVDEVDDEETKKLIDFAAIMKRGKALEFLLDHAYPLHKTLEPKLAQALLANVFGSEGSQRFLTNTGEVKRQQAISPGADAKSCIEILISRGAKLEHVQRPGEIIRWAGLDTVEFLLQQDPLWVKKSFLACNLAYSKSVLHDAILYGRTPAHAQLLVHAGAEINSVDERGNTPLCICTHGYKARTDLANAQVLINHGAQLDEIDKVRERYYMNEASLRKIKAMVPQTPCCPLGVQTGTVPQSSGHGTWTTTWAGRLEQSSSNELASDDLLETAGLLGSDIDEEMASDNESDLQPILSQLPNEADMD